MTELHEVDLALSVERFAAARDALAPLPSGPARWIREARLALELGEGNPLEAMRRAELAAQALGEGDPDRVRALEVALDAALRCRAAQTAQSYMERLEALWSIAKRTYGDGAQYRKIVSANPSVRNDRLIVGQTITLP